MFLGIPSVASRRTVVRLIRSSRLWLAFIALAAVSRVAAAVAPLPSEALASELVVRSLALVDTPYRYGGRTPAGFDCSGFVGFVFAEAAGVSLPRRTEEIWRIGDGVARSELAVGDLVFFNTLGRRLSHVGIYIGDGVFVHAPARGGRVRVERLSDAYWEARYNGARRMAALLPEAQYASASAAATTAATEASVEVRVTP
jgi:cell wall-associated NlpC family hydrolase